MIRRIVLMQMVLWCGAFVQSGCGAASGTVELRQRYFAVQRSMAEQHWVEVGPVLEGELAQDQSGKFPLNLTVGYCYTAVLIGKPAQYAELTVETSALSPPVTTQSQGEGKLRFCPLQSGKYTLGVSTRKRGGDKYLIGLWRTLNPAKTTALDAPLSGEGSCESPTVLPFDVWVKGKYTRDDKGSETGDSVDESQRYSAVYAFEISQKNKVEFHLYQTEKVELQLRKTCGDENSKLGYELSSPSGIHRLAALLDTGKYYLVVQHRSTAENKPHFGLFAHKTALPSLQQRCQDAPTITPGQSTKINLADGVNHLAVPCNTIPSAPELIYQLHVQDKSRVRFSWPGTTALALMLKKSCATQSPALTCLSHSGQGAILESGDYTVFVEPQSLETEGELQLAVDVTPIQSEPVPGDTLQQPILLDASVYLQQDSFDTVTAHDHFSSAQGGKGAPDLVYRFDLGTKSRIKTGLFDLNFSALFCLGQAQTGVFKNISCISCAPSSQCTPTEYIDQSLAAGSYRLTIDGKTENDFGQGYWGLWIRDEEGPEQACQSAQQLKWGKPKKGRLDQSTPNFFESQHGKGRDGPDVVYKLSVKQTTEIELSISASFNGVGYLMSACDIGGDSDMFIWMISPETSNVVAPKLEPGDYFVVIDGHKGATGPFTVVANKK